MTHQSQPNDRPPAGDELLTISEVAAIVRAPIATCATGATSAPDRSASESAAACAAGATTSPTGFTSKAGTTAHTSTDPNRQARSSTTTVAEGCYDMTMATSGFM